MATHGRLELAYIGGEVGCSAGSGGGDGGRGGSTSQGGRRGNSFTGVGTIIAVGGVGIRAITGVSGVGVRVITGVSGVGVRAITGVSGVGVRVITGASEAALLLERLCDAVMLGVLWKLVFPVVAILFLQEFPESVVGCVDSVERAVQSEGHLVVHKCQSVPTRNQLPHSTT